MSLSVVIKTPTVSYEQPLGLYIDGKWAAGVEQKTFETINPANECIIASVCEAGVEDIDIAVKAARKALNGIWAQTAPSQRGRLLTKLADLFEEDLETLSAIESLDNGKAISLSRGDVQAAADVLRYYGGWADKLHGKVIDTDPETLNYTRHEPIGIGPALATGNTVVLKTAEQTPLSGLYAANLCHKAGIPAGVVNIVSGVGGVAGAALAAHMDVDKIAFTGSTLIGRKILRAAADSNLKKVTLELGGKSPNIVFNDATIDLAISWVNFGIFFNQGQCCCAGSRIYVQSGVYDQFVEAFKARVGRNIVGDPFADNTFQGPQVSRLQYDRIMGYIRSGNEEGATLEIGGQRQGTEGFYIQPTVFSNVKPEMTIMREEIFGPVCVICKFETEEEVVRLSNDSVYGLAAAVHTRDLNTAIRVSNALSAGTVWVNNYNMLTAQVPFGGCKESGIGRELGKYALSNYTHVKSVRIRVGGALF